MGRFRSKSVWVALAAVASLWFGDFAAAQDPAERESVRLEMGRLPADLRQEFLEQPSAVQQGRIVELDRSALINILEQMDAADEIGDSAVAIREALLPQMDPRFGGPPGVQKMQPFEPAQLETAIDGFLVKKEQDCRRKRGIGAQQCLAEVELFRSWQDATSAAAVACNKDVVNRYLDAAARDLAAKGSLTKQYSVEFRQFDEACMAGPTPWSRPGLGVGIDREPGAFRRSAAADGGAGALAVVGLIQVLNKDRQWEHRCGGLLLRPERPGGPVRILTALHCFEGDADSLTNGRVRVARAINGDTYMLSRSAGGSSPGLMLGAHPTSVAQDYIMLELVGAPSSMPLPAVEFRPPSRLTEVVAVSYFIHHAEDRALHDPQAVAGVASRLDWWRRGLRWARPGMCRALPADRDCVRLFCQTTYGFSGTPVFVAEPDRAGPLIVHGLISFPERFSDSQPDCNAPLLGAGLAAGVPVPTATLNANAMSTLAVLPTNSIITGNS